MDLKRRYLHLIPSFVIATSLILSACQDSGQSRVRIAKGGDAGARGEAMERIKLSAEQEKSVKDPLTLEAYEKVLKPIFEKMDADASVSWSSLFKLKRWIISPSDIKKEVPSPVSISSSATYGEYARQTMYDVLVSAAAYDKQNENEKADILLNEFLTALYSVKNFSDDELCQLVKSQNIGIENCAVKKNTDLETGEAEGNGDLEEILASQNNGESSKDETDVTGFDDSDNDDSKAAVRRKDPPKKDTPSVDKAASTAKKPLVKEDYEKIAHVKKYIHDQGQNLVHGELVSAMRENGFDMRVFSYKQKKSSVGKDKNSLVIQGDDVESLFAQVASLQGSSQTCYSVRGGTKMNCQIQAQRWERGIPGSEKSQGFLNISLKTEKTEKLLSETIYQMPKIKISIIPETNEEVSLVPLYGLALKNRQVGASYRVNYLLVTKVLTQSEENLKLEGFLSIPGTVTEIKNESNHAKKCAGKLAEMNDKGEDVILVTDAEEYLELTKKILPTLHVLPPCW